MKQTAIILVREYTVSRDVNNICDISNTKLELLLSIMITAL